MQKDCPSCGAKKVLIEALDDGYRLTCQSCSFSQVYNDKGKKLLTDERYNRPFPMILVD